MKLINKNKISDPVFDVKNKITRVLWNLAYFLFFRYTPIFLFKWRVMILRFFGASLGYSSRIYPTARFWLPSNITLGHNSTIGPSVNIYNQGHVIIGSNVIISQGAHICASTHDYNCELHPLILRPIKIHDYAWVCADAFIGPGVNVSEGTVVGARAALFKDSEAWSVYSGNPAVLIKKREIFKNG